jgi:ABC-type microcin C transport system permease subunit YejB
MDADGFVFAASPAGGAAGNTEVQLFIFLWLHILLFCGGSFVSLFPCQPIRCPSIRPGQKVPHFCTYVFRHVHQCP